MPPSSVGPTLTITVNGESLPITAGTTALAVVESLGLAGRPIAVEVNEVAVPRARLAHCMLEVGDRLEIVTLVGGG